MINKTKFLSSLGCARGRLAKEINELIFNWHYFYGIDNGPNEINNKVKETLYIATLYWKNLILSEAEGFRDAMGRRTFQKLLKDILETKGTINYFGILCPSYKKGIRALGFAQEPGNTTYRAFSNLNTMIVNTQSLGIKCDAKMLFADISVENYDQLSDKDWKDFDRIIWLNSIIAKAHNVSFVTLTQFAIELSSIVGRSGRIVDINKLNVSQKAFRRSLWRDRQFYPKNLGWTIEEADLRTITHAHSYCWQAEFIRKKLKNPVMIYSAYDYEKAGLYNGKNGDLLPAVIFPLKDSSNSLVATIPHWLIK